MPLFVPRLVGIDEHVDDEVDVAFQRFANIIAPTLAEQPKLPADRECLDGSRLEYARARLGTALLHQPVELQLGLRKLNPQHVSRERHDVLRAFGPHTQIGQDLQRTRRFAGGKPKLALVAMDHIHDAFLASPHLDGVVRNCRNGTRCLVNDCSLGSDILITYNAAYILEYLRFDVNVTTT